MIKDDMFNKTPAEPSNGEPVDPSPSGGEPILPSQGEPQVPEPKHQEGTPQWFKSQLDKMSNEYKQQLTEKEKAWVEKEQQLTGQVQNILKEFETIKNPPQKPEVLTPPKPPVDAEDPTQVLRYQSELIDYNNKVWEQKFNTLNEKFGKTETQLAQEAELKKQQHQFEANKAYLLGEFSKYGTAEEAMEIWNDYSSKNLFEPHSIVEYHRYKKGNKKPPANVVKEKFPLPAGLGSNANVNADEKDNFMAGIGSNKHSNIFDKK